MLTVYNVGAEYLEKRRALLEMQSDEAIPAETIINTLAGISHEMKEVALNFAAICKNLAPEIELMREYELKMQAKRHALEKELQAYKKWIIENMQAYEVQKIENDELLVYRRKNAESVKIADDVDLNSLPGECLKFSIEPRLTVIKEWLKSGGKRDGVTLERSESVIIK